MSGESEPAGGADPLPVEDAAWRAREEGVFSADAQLSEQDESKAVAAASDDRGRWNPFRRSRQRAEVLDAEIDRTEVRFEEGVAADIASGVVEPPPGGPVSAAEEDWALEHPWPGHTNRESIERERAAQEPGSGTSPPRGAADHQ